MTYTSVLEGLEQFKITAKSGGVLVRPRGGATRTASRGANRHGQRRHHRTIWISDVHLGTRGCKADVLLDFLVQNECDVLYLVGDIIDGWRLSRSWFWLPSHNAVIDEVLRKARNGTRVVSVP